MKRPHPTPAPQPEDLYINFGVHPYTVYTVTGKFLAAYSSVECASRTVVWHKQWDLDCEIRHKGITLDLTSCKQIAANAHIEAQRNERMRVMMGRMPS